MIYRALLRPLLFRIDPETIHHGASWVLRKRWLGPILGLGAGPRVGDCMRTGFCGIDLAHPIGLAAGFDKNATMAPSLVRMGFSHLEIGTVTGEPQAGNPRPRLFRLPRDGALINRMGFNNQGSAVVADRIRTMRLGVPLGGNIGKTKVVPLEQAESDYLKSFEALHGFVDYFVVNVSSPNTPNLRALQDREPLTRLLTRLVASNQPHKPLLLKIAPDLSDGQIEDIAAVVEEVGLDGVIATNTTINRDGLSTPRATVERLGVGGLSGRPLARRSTQVVARLRRCLPKGVDIVGVGGIFSGEDAYQKIRAGACALQIYTGFIYRGPGAVRLILDELRTCLRRDGFDRVTDAIGVDADHLNQP